MAKAKKKTKKAPSLKQLRSTSYELVWDEPRKNCMFGHHTSGVSGKVMCGVTDAVSCFTDGKRYYILSVNYDEGYAALEVLDGEDEPLAICFAEPKDVKKIFGKDWAKTKPKVFAERLAKECM